MTAFSDADLHESDFVGSHKDFFVWNNRKRVFEML